MLVHAMIWPVSCLRFVFVLFVCSIVLCTAFQLADYLTEAKELNFIFFFFCLAKV